MVIAKVIAWLRGVPKPLVCQDTFSKHCEHLIGSVLRRQDNSDCMKEYTHNKFVCCRCGHTTFTVDYF